MKEVQGSIVSLLVRSETFVILWLSDSVVAEGRVCGLCRSVRRKGQLFGLKDTKPKEKALSQPSNLANKRSLTSR